MTLPTVRLIGETLEDRRLLAGMPELLGDLGRSLSIDPGYEFAEAGGTVYFTGAISTTGENELWKSDGTAAGTLPVKDLTTSGGAAVNDLAELNGTLYFLADDRRGHFGLWKSDGTSFGTQFVHSFRASYGNNTGVRTLASAGGMLFMLVRGTSNTDELWTSDGTDGGTALVKKLPRYTTFTRGLVSTENSVFFEVAGTSVGTYELWTSDGSTQGTRSLKVLSGLMDGPTAVGNELFFSAQLPGGSAGRELWKTDGTTGGTVQVKDIQPGAGGSSPSSLSHQAGILYFTANDGTHGSEPWRSDGTEAGTYQIRDLGPGDSGPQSYIAVGDKTYFSASIAGSSSELWETDGTEAGTVAVAAQQFGGQRAELNGRLFLLDAQGSLWRFDPQDNSLLLIAGGAFYSLQTRGGKLYLTDEHALTISDGTSAGTTSITRPAHGLTHSGATNFVGFNGATYFTAADENGGALWRDSGTGNAVRVLGKNADWTGLDPFGLVAFDGSLFFRADDGTSYPHWYRSDGTEAGTHLAVDMTEIGRDVYKVVVDEELIYFSMWNDGSQRLWRTDGTQAGTINLASYATELGLAGERLFFNGGNELGAELWKSDGTVAGTVLVKDIQPGSLSSGPRQMTALGSQLYFVADDGAHGSELWTSDGTDAGTRLVKDLTPGPASTYFANLIAVGDSLFLSGNSGGVVGLWKVSDSGEDIELVRTFSNLGDWQVYGLLDGVLYFLAEDAANKGLWRSDGTTEGTYLVKAFSGPGSALRFTAVGPWLYFAADDGVHGSEVWRTDGTEAGTQLVADLAPGPEGSEPVLHPAVGGAVYFVAHNGVTGFDPWVIRPAHVVGREMFYNDSAFDGDSAAAEAADDGAIATDKVAYAAGSGIATGANISSYVHGINGLMIDLAGLERTLSAADFTFRVGTSNAPDSWALAPAPLEVVVRAGAGLNGSDRVTITWADGAIKNTWLQVTVRGNDAAGGFNTNTGLAGSDVFYFGSRVGDSFARPSPLVAMTSVYDELLARMNPGLNQPVTSPYDFDRDGKVGLADQLIVRNNSGLLPLLELGAVEALVAGGTPGGPADAGVFGAHDQNSPRSSQLSSTAVAFALASLEAGEELDEWGRLESPRPRGRLR